MASKRDRIRQSDPFDRANRAKGAVTLEDMMEGMLKESGRKPDADPSDAAVELVKELPDNAMLVEDEGIRMGSYTLTSVGLQINEETTTIEEWDAVGKVLFQLADSMQWLIGDWINFGEKNEKKWGETYKEAIALIDRRYQTFRNWKWVAGSIELSRRRDKLSFSHHEVVAGLPVEKQDEWLDWAVSQENSVSVGTFRQMVRESKTGEGDALVDAFSRAFTAFENRLKQQVTALPDDERALMAERLRQLADSVERGEA